MSQYRHARESGHPGAAFLAADERKRPCIYILASARNGTLYVGVTANIAGRTWLHKTATIEGFTKRYAVHRLVYVEFHDTMEAAIIREKQIKKW